MVDLKVKDYEDGCGHRWYSRGSRPIRSGNYPGYTHRVAVFCMTCKITGHVYYNQTTLAQLGDTRTQVVRDKEYRTVEHDRCEGA